MRLLVVALLVVCGCAGSTATSRVHARETEPRTPLRAIPSSARFALAMNWSSLRKGLPFFSRIFNVLDDSTKDTLFWLERLAATKDDQGFDPAEGIAVVRVPGDYVPWILVGTLDDAIADSTVRRLLEIQGAAAAVPLAEPLPQGARLWSAAGSNRRTMVWGYVGGYLALRVGWRQDPEAAVGFAALAAAERAPLADYAPYVRARPLAGTGDLQGWIVLEDLTYDPPIEGAALAASSTNDALDLHFGLALSPERIERYAPAFRTATPRRSGIFSFPPGADAALALSVDPRAFFELFVTDPTDRELVEDAAASKHVNVDEVLAPFTGHFSVSFFLGDQLLEMLNDTPRMVVKAELGSDAADSVRGIVPFLEDRALPDDEPWSAEVSPDRLTVWRRDLRPLLSQPGEDVIAEAMGPELLADPTEQILYIDLHALRPAVEPLVKSGEPDILLPYIDESLRALRDLTLHGALTEQGVRGGLRIRLQPQNAR